MGEVGGVGVRRIYVVNWKIFTVVLFPADSQDAPNVREK